MIQETEIRIGNWFIGYDKPFKWELKHFAIMVDRVDLDEIIKEPILLTPEILSKCHFPKSIKISTIEGNTRTQTLEINAGKYAWHETSNLKFKTLHHLQNIYFDHAGEELIYTP